MPNLEHIRHAIHTAVAIAKRYGYLTAPNVWGVVFDGDRKIVPSSPGTRAALHPLACVGAFLSYDGVIPRPEGDEASTVFVIAQSLNVSEGFCQGFINGFNQTRGLETGTDAYRLGKEFRTAWDKQEADC